MGRAAKPTALKKFEGKYVSPHLGEPQPPPLGDFEPPADMDGIAAEKWRELVKLLEPLGMLTVVDVDALRIYCEAWQELQDCNATLKREGSYQKVSSSGKKVAHPALSRRDHALDRIRRYSQEFGLTPASRSRVDIGAGAKAMPKGKLAKYAVTG